MEFGLQITPFCIIYLIFSPETYAHKESNTIMSTLREKALNSGEINFFCKVRRIWTRN